MTIQAELSKAKSLWVKIPTVLLIVAGICLAIFAAYWIGKRTADKEARIHELEVQLKDLQSQRTQVQQQTNGAVESVRQTRASIQTPQEAITDLNTNLGIHVGIVPGRVQGAQAGDVPPVTTLEIPTSEIQRVTSGITDYKVLGIQLAGCKSELGLCDKEVANLKEQLKLQKPSRFKQCLGDVGSNSLTGVVVAQNKQNGAIIGAAVGLTKCLVLK